MRSLSQAARRIGDDETSGRVPGQAKRLAIGVCDNRPFAVCLQTDNLTRFQPRVDTSKRIDGHVFRPASTDL